MAQSGSYTDCDYVWKVLVAGASGSGKSSLTVRLSEDVFFSDYASTIAIDFRMYQLMYEGKKMKLQIWDTAGQERFQSVTSSFFRGANGVLLCFDITSRQSFDSLPNWLERIRMQALPGVPILLVGCKADDERNRRVDKAEAQGWARQNGMDYLETSAKDNTNVLDAFQHITRLIMDANRDRGRLPPTAGGNVGTVGGNAPLRLGAGGPGAHRGAQSTAGGGASGGGGACDSC